MLKKLLQYRIVKVLSRIIIIIIIIIIYEDRAQHKVHKKRNSTN